MTKAQQIHYAFIDASELFDDDMEALSVAIHGIVKNAGKKVDKYSVSQDIKEGRLEKYEHIFPKVISLTENDIQSCKAIAKCRFGFLHGRLEEVERLSGYVDNMKSRSRGQEISHINSIIEMLKNIKHNLKS